MMVVRKIAKPDYKNAERRYDQFGEFRLMARAEGYVMFRRKGCAAHVMTEAEWDRLSKQPVE
jgi:hypothetical protein